jgi:protein SCO1
MLTLMERVIRMFAPRRTFLLLMALILLGPAAVALAHVEEPAVKGAPSAPAVAGSQGTGAGITLDERLGEKIPLSTTFRDESGKFVRLGELITGPTIIVPVYYGCTNVCNFLQSGLASALPAIKARPAVDYRLISVSIDETENPALAARMKRMHLREIAVPFPDDGWRFLTGEAKNIRSLTDAAGYRFERRGRDFVHPVASIVVAKDGTIVRYLYGTTFLPKDLSLALLEARDGKVGITVRKLVDYCFSFDPAGRGYQLNLLRISATVITLCCGAFLVFLVTTTRSYRQKNKGKR